jgi:hypothetical protein
VSGCVRREHRQHIHVRDLSVSYDRSARLGITAFLVHMTQPDSAGSRCRSLLFERRKYQPSELGKPPFRMSANAVF